MQHKIPEKIGYPLCMEAFQTRWSRIQERLGTRINDVEVFVEYLEIQALKAYELKLIMIAEEIEKYRGYLEFLKNIIKDYYLESRWFGLEVFLSELDDLFINCIDPLKISLNTFLNDPSSVNRAAVNRSFSNLNSNLYKCPFIETMGKEIRSVSKFLSTSISSDFSNDSFEILYKYLDVGETLKNDEVTERLLEQITRLHTEADPISMYSAIIGPSFMGKTQTAFTLSSCLINVIYVNFIPTLIDNSVRKSQKIYMLFKGIAELFKEVINEDELKLKKAKLDKTAEEIKVSNISFQTLGLIYLLLRTRKIREAEYAQDQVFSVKDWLVEIVNIKSAIIPLMNIRQFLEKTEGNH